jgi:hypothetical protein
MIMLKDFLNKLRNKSHSLEDLPDTIRVPGHGETPTIDGLRLEVASVDEIAFAIQGLEARSSEISCQLHSLRRLHDLARRRGALGIDKVITIFGEEL